MSGEQLDLFRRRKRKTDPRTSLEAAARVIEFDNSHYARILACLKQTRRAMTFHEISAHTGMDSQQVNKRLPEMERAGLVYLYVNCYGIPITRASPSGRQCRLWSVL